MHSDPVSGERLGALRRSELRGGWKFASLSCEAREEDEVVTKSEQLHDIDIPESNAQRTAFPRIAC